MEIVTGYCGEPHVTANDHQAFNYGVVGDCILPVGSEFGFSLYGSNQLIIQDGDIIHKGVHSRIPYGSTDTVTLENGPQDKKRIDLVCVQYTKGQDNVESVEWVVIKGNESTSNPVVPSYTDGNIVAGAVLSQTPVFKITFNGVTPTVEKLLKVSMNVASMSDRLLGTKVKPNDPNDKNWTNRIPRVLHCGSMLISSTSADNVTLYSIPTEYDANCIAATVTNGHIEANGTVLISTYISLNGNNRTVRAKLNQRIQQPCRINYIIWYWGD